MKIDISTPELLHRAIERASNNKRHLLSLLCAMGACSRRRKLATTGLSVAFRRANVDDLCWYLCRVASRMAGGNVTSFDRCDWACRHIASNSGLSRAERRRLQANLLRTFYNIYGENITTFPVL